MRAQLLLIQLPYSIEHLRPELDAVVACLPEGSKKVIYTDTLVGIAMPHIDVPEVVAVRLRKPIQAFSNWWIIGLNGQIICKERSNDPLRFWMNKYLGLTPRPQHKPSNIRKRPEIVIKEAGATPTWSNQPLQPREVTPFQKEE